MAFKKENRSGMGTGRFFLGKSNIYFYPFAMWAVCSGSGRWCSSGSLRCSMAVSWQTWPMLMDRTQSFAGSPDPSAGTQYRLNNAP